MAPKWARAWLPIRSKQELAGYLSLPELHQSRARPVQFDLLEIWCEATDVPRRGSKPSGRGVRYESVAADDHGDGEAERAPCCRLPQVLELSDDCLSITSLRLV